MRCDILTKDEHAPNFIAIPNIQQPMQKFSTPSNVARAASTQSTQDPTMYNAFDWLKNIPPPMDVIIKPQKAANCFGGPGTKVRGSHMLLSVQGR